MAFACVRACGHLAWQVLYCSMPHLGHPVLWQHCIYAHSQDDANDDGQSGLAAATALTIPPFSITGRSKIFLS
eukprot:6259347-Amphidinium_carterae.1